MKAKDLKQKTLPELQKMLKELQGKLFEHKILKVRNQLKKPHLLKNIKKDIARIMTVINIKRPNI
jgi:large subunit ribosomal protein L29